MSKILVADDDAGVRELCGVVLRNEGFEVIEAEDAGRCIALAREEQPDLVLLDWMMPDVDGIDALRMLKGSSATEAIPVVMLTALDGLPQITLATYNGADSYMTKPFEMDDLLSLVRRYTDRDGAPGTLPPA
ncbi:MAG TPA: response regulator [Armatimonadota bacterium]|nr:response regulator [Armatimonadota bacterium]